MSDEFNKDEEAAQGENPEAAASADDQNVDAATDASADDAPVDPIDAELADLVDATGPISKEAELLADLQRLQAEFVNYKARVERDREFRATLQSPRFCEHSCQSTGDSCNNTTTR